MVTIQQEQSMKDSRLAAFVRALTNGALSRRGLARGLAGVAVTAGLIHSGLDDLDAKKRKKRRKGKKRKRRGQSAGDDAGSGGTPCGGTLCNGQCVNLNTDVKNCGACGAVCDVDGAVCVEGRCVEVIGSQGFGDGQFQDPTGIALNADGVVFVTDTGNDRLVVLGGGEFGDADFAQPIGVA